jgi:hypothetical protein
VDKFRIPLLLAIELYLLFKKIADYYFAIFLADSQYLHKAIDSLTNNIEKFSYVNGFLFELNKNLMALLVLIN